MSSYLDLQYERFETRKLAAETGNMVFVNASGVVG